ncbi:ABC-type transporter Mla subunit MlaD [Granulicella aggregans]|uniref:ABC-type transporter Mla subunit MlaD n=1 Tax=Granulicella aggregans TaxID=474949 RepID=A0A7W7ZHE6_9BACT|nr:ABC-type transporter Mla subunit MlaD [Granulicella aggregans]
MGRGKKYQWSARVSSTTLTGSNFIALEAAPNLPSRYKRRH